MHTSAWVKCWLVIDPKGRFGIKVTWVNAVHCRVMIKRYVNEEGCSMLTAVMCGITWVTLMPFFIYHTTLHANLNNVGNWLHFCNRSLSRKTFCLKKALVNIYECTCKSMLNYVYLYYLPCLLVTCRYSLKSPLVSKGWTTKVEVVSREIKNYENWRLTMETLLRKKNWWPTWLQLTLQ